MKKILFIAIGKIIFSYNSQPCSFKVLYYYFASDINSAIFGRAPKKHRVRGLFASVDVNVLCHCIIIGSFHKVNV